MDGNGFERGFSLAIICQPGGCARILQGCSLLFFLSFYHTVLDETPVLAQVCQTIYGGVLDLGFYTMGRNWAIIVIKFISISVDKMRHTIQKRQTPSPGISQSKHRTTLFRQLAILRRALAEPEETALFRMQLVRLRRLPMSI